MSNIPPPATNESTYRIMESSIEANAAIDTVIGKALQRLRVFDTNPQRLKERGFGAPGRIDSLRRLLLASRHHRLDIVLHEAQGIESEVPRLVTLLGQFSGQVAIHRTVEVAREARDAMVIADSAHVWHKLHADHPRSVLIIDHPGDALPRIERFGEIWEKSEVAISGTQIGL
jgi:hypothetical protein